MKGRYRLAVGAACAVGAAWSSAGVARADVFALTTPRQMFRIVHFGGDGRFVASHPAGAESSEGIDASADGWVYYNNNLIGSGILSRFRPERPDNRQQLTGFGEDGFNIPLGVTVAPDGSVYATSNAFNPGGISGVFRYNPVDQTFAPVVVVPDAPDFGIQWVAVGPDGDIYLTRSGAGVERYAANGQRVGVVAPVVGDIEFGPDGNLYVATPQGVDRYNPASGAFIGRFIPNGAGGLDRVADFAFGGDGLVYVNASDRILRYDALTGAFRDTFVTPEQYALAGPGGVREITFVVPEPAAVVLIAAAPCLLLRRRRSSRRA